MHELNDASDLESTFRRIAKDKSDCSSGQRGGKIIFSFLLKDLYFLKVILACLVMVQCKNHLKKLPLL
jgi:hypothetical protein